MATELNLSEVINDLREKGYTEDFNLTEECIECREGLIKLYPEDFHVDKVYRFEGQSDPDDQAVLYAISSEKHNLKGVLVNSYGIYSDPVTNKLLAKLDMKSHK